MKRVILFLILAFLVSINTPLNSYAGDYAGKICFQLDNYPVERFVWELDKVGDAYQITGTCPHFRGGLNGGGSFDFLTLDLVMTETDRDGWLRIFSIEIDLPSLTGTADFKWFDDLGHPAGVYNDEPFSYVPCSAPLDPEGPDSRMRTQVGQICPDGDSMYGLDNEGNIICRGPEHVGANCPDGDYMYGFDNEGNIICRGPEPVAANCPDGEFMTGLDNEGNIICRGP